MAEQRFESFDEFWPFYLGEHSNNVCRGLHFVGSTLALVFVVTAVVTATPWLLLGAAVVGYGFAWVGHFVFEKNKPATFQHPWWSFCGDWKMWLYILTGRIRGELSRHDIATA